MRSITIEKPFLSLPKLEHLPYRLEKTDNPNQMVLVTKDTNFICGLVCFLPDEFSIERSSLGVWSMVGLFGWGFGCYILETLISAIGYAWMNYYSVRYHLGQEYYEFGFDRGEPNYAYEKESRLQKELTSFWRKVDDMSSPKS